MSDALPPGNSPLPRATDCGPDDRDHPDAPIQPSFREELVRSGLMAPTDIYAPRWMAALAASVARCAGERVGGAAALGRGHVASGIRAVMRVDGSGDAVRALLASNGWVGAPRALDAYVESLGAVECAIHGADR